MRINFNPATAPKREASDLLPVGWYEAICSKADIAPTKTGGGQVLSLDWTIQQAGYVGRKTWSRHNIENRNPEAQRIGQEELNEICEALGIVMLEDTDDLLNKPLYVKIKIEKDDSGKYDDKSVPARFKAKGSAVQLVTPGTTPAGAAPKPAAAPAMPAFARQAPAQGSLVPPAGAAETPAAPSAAPAQVSTAAASPAAAAAQSTGSAGSQPPWVKKAA